MLLLSIAYLTPSTGGSIGWIKETQLSKKILENIENLNFGKLVNNRCSIWEINLILKDKRV